MKKITIDISNNCMMKDERSLNLTKRKIQKIFLDKSSNSLLFPSLSNQTYILNLSLASKIENLDLSSNILGDLDNLEYFSSILHVNLSNNKITYLNNKLPKNLKFIDLSQNKIITLNNLKNPKKSVFDRVEKLEKLLMSGNEIEKLEDHVFKNNTCLKFVDITSNKLKGNYRTFPALRNIQTVLIDDSYSHFGNRKQKSFDFNYFCKLNKEKKEKSLNTNSNSSKNISSSNHKTSTIQNISKMEIEEEEDNNNIKEVQEQVPSFKMNFMDYVSSSHKKLLLEDQAKTLHLIQTYHQLHNSQKENIDPQFEANFGIMNQNLKSFIEKPKITSFQENKINIVEINTPQNIFGFNCGVMNAYEKNLLGGVNTGSIKKNSLHIVERKTNQFVVEAGFECQGKQRPKSISFQTPPPSKIEEKIAEFENKQKDLIQKENERIKEEKKNIKIEKVKLEPDVVHQRKNSYLKIIKTQKEKFEQFILKLLEILEIKTDFSIKNLDSLLKLIQTQQEKQKKINHDFGNEALMLDMKKKMASPFEGNNQQKKAILGLIKNILTNLEEAKNIKQLPR